MPQDMPKVALLVETSQGYGRELLRGVMRYARLHGPWGFYLQPGDLRQLLPRMEEWGGTGIIARVENPEAAKAVLASRLPAVVLDLSPAQLQPEHPLSRLPEVRPDSPAAARLAAEHLLERGFCHFAFVGTWGDYLWSIERGEGFARRIAEAAMPCEAFPIPKAARDRRWGREQAILARWLQSRPKPLGVLAADDDRGRQVLEACRAAGLSVPEDVAVVGVDNDELLCSLSDPPLSSVAMNTEEAGYQAAALLHGLMTGRIRKPRRILVEAAGVVARRSTDVHTADDRRLAKALRFIRDNAVLPIGVDDVVEHVGGSRRALELRFRRIVGRSINQEIQSVRLQRAKQLLAETDLTIARVAEAVGLGSPSYLIRLFRQHLDCSPSQYRASLGRQA